jgi:hypothetical protein
MPIQYGQKQIDLDGRFSFSKEILVSGKKLTALQVSSYPNPVKDIAQIQIQLTEKSIINLQLFNVAGLFVMNITGGEKQAGIHSIPVTMGYLPAGNYYAVLTTNTGEKYTLPILKQ